MHTCAYLICMHTIDKAQKLAVSNNLLYQRLKDIQNRPTTDYRPAVLKYKVNQKMAKFKETAMEYKKKMMKKRKKVCICAVTCKRISYISFMYIYECAYVCYVTHVCL